MEKSSNLGFLHLNEDGAVLKSGGDLDNNEHVAGIIFNLVNTVSKKNLGPLGSTPNFHRISIHYGTHIYSIVLSNKRYHIVKRKYLPNEPVVA